MPEHLSVVDAMTRATGGHLNSTQSRTILGNFLFTQEEVDRKVGVLSGGERRRLALAALVAGGANLLVLDEPTNHLDVEAREALEEALDAYDGTVLLVSHDRALIDAVATHTASIEERRIVLRHGDYNDYLEAVAERPRRARARAAAGAKAKPKRDAAAAPRPRQEPAKRRPSQRTQRLIRDLETASRSSRRSRRRSRRRSPTPRRRRRPRPPERARDALPAGAGGARLEAPRVGTRAGRRRPGGLTVRPRGTLGLMFAADRVQDLLRRLREDVAALIHSEIDLAKTEVVEKIKMHAKAAVLDRHRDPVRAARAARVPVRRDRRARARRAAVGVGADRRRRARC